MMDDKYIVFKRPDFEKLLVDLAGSLSPEVGNALNNFVSGEVPDAVVIRRQDVFAPPALDSYANSITVAMQLVPETGEPGIKERLSAIADYFHDQAEQSWHTDRKLPD